MRPISPQLQSNDAWYQLASLESFEDAVFHEEALRIVIRLNLGLILARGQSMIVPSLQSEKIIIAQFKALPNSKISARCVGESISTSPTHSLSSSVSCYCCSYWKRSKHSERNLPRQVTPYCQTVATQIERG